jgi:ribosomal protein L3
LVQTISLIALLVQDYDEAIAFFTDALRFELVEDTSLAEGKRWVRVAPPGSIGATTFPGRVLKGKRMAGHMGNERVTARNLEVVQADPERNLLLVKGAVPGANGGLLVIEKVR